MNDPVVIAAQSRAWRFLRGVLQAAALICATSVSPVVLAQDSSSGTPSRVELAPLTVTEGVSHTLADGTVLGCTKGCKVSSRVVNGETMVSVSGDYGLISVEKSETTIRMSTPNPGFDFVLPPGADIEIGAGKTLSVGIPQGKTFVANGTEVTCSLACSLTDEDFGDAKMTAVVRVAAGGAIDVRGGARGADITGVGDSGEVKALIASPGQIVSLAQRTIKLADLDAGVETIRVAPGQTAIYEKDGVQTKYTCAQGCTLSAEGPLSGGGISVSQGVAKTWKEAYLPNGGSVILEGVTYTCRASCTLSTEEPQNVKVQFWGHPGTATVAVANPENAPAVKLTLHDESGAKDKLVTVGGGEKPTLGASGTVIEYMGKDKSPESRVVTFKEPFNLAYGETLRVPELGNVSVTCAARTCTVQFDPEMRTLRVDYFPSGIAGAVPFTVSGGTASPPVRVIYGTRSDADLLDDDIKVQTGEGDGRFFVDSGDKVVVIDEAPKGHDRVVTPTVQVVQGDGADRNVWAVAVGEKFVVAQADTGGSTGSPESPPMSGISNPAAGGDRGIPGPHGPGMPFSGNDELGPTGTPSRLPEGPGVITSWPAGAFSIEVSFGALVTATTLDSHTVYPSGALKTFGYNAGSSYSGTAAGTPTVCTPSECPAPQTVRWGTWSAGTVIDPGVSNTVSATNRLHWLIGSATSPAVIDARTGTVNYARLGGTSPVGANGTVYSASAGNLSVTFGVSPSATLASYSVTRVSGPSGTNYAFTAIPLTISTIGGIKSLSTGGTVNGSNSGLLQMEGLFLGATGNHAGFAVNVTSSVDSAVKINAVEVFKQQ